MNTKITILIIFAFGLVNSAFSQSDLSKTYQASPAPPAIYCILNPTEGNTAKGKVTFIQVKDGVKVIVDMYGLTPGKHGFHIHEFGDCSAPDGTSAGGHYNPEMKEHAGPMDHSRHDGDMGNITADENGVAHLEYVDKQIKLEGKNSIVGKSIIVHQNEDDLKTQPTGNAGPRIACGVIEMDGC